MDDGRGPGDVGPDRYEGQPAYPAPAVPPGHPRDRLGHGGACQSRQRDLCDRRCPGARSAPPRAPPSSRPSQVRSRPGPVWVSNQDAVEKQAPRLVVFNDVLAYEILARVQGGDSRPVEGLCGRRHRRAAAPGEPHPPWCARGRRGPHRDRLRLQGEGGARSPSTAGGTTWASISCATIPPSGASTTRTGSTGPRTLPGTGGPRTGPPSPWPATWS